MALGPLNHPGNWTDAHQYSVIASPPLLSGVFLVALSQPIRKKLLNTVIVIPLVVLLEGV